MSSELFISGRKLLPSRLFKIAQPAYHYLLSFISALLHRFPSRNINIVFITGTKGKTTVTELITSVLENAGFVVALSNGSRTMVAGRSEKNASLMTTPGRFFLQKFLRNAVSSKCDWAIIEMTSQAVSQFRHKFIDFNSLIFTGIHPEHIESHGSFENYLASKLELAKALADSPKRPRAIVANIDDLYGQEFLKVEIENGLGFSINNVSPWKSTEYGTTLTFMGSRIDSELPGEFNLMNILATMTFAQSQGITIEKIKKGIEQVTQVAGRMEHLETARKAGIEIIVDYAHTTGSLEAIYKLYAKRKTICVLGSMGDGRDKWKRPQMGVLADKYCDNIVLTNEGPGDEDPMVIIDDILVGIKNKAKVMIEMNRRKAISKGIAIALKEKNLSSVPVVLLTGFGNYPYIIHKDWKEPWNEKLVAEEELAKLIN